MTIKDYIIDICKSIGKVSISDILKYVKNNGWFGKGLGDNNKVGVWKIRKFVKDGIDVITESEEQNMDTEG